MFFVEEEHNEIFRKIRLLVYACYCNQMEVFLCGYIMLLEERQNDLTVKVVTLGIRYLLIKVSISKVMKKEGDYQPQGLLHNDF